MSVKAIFCGIYFLFTAPLIKNLHLEITECSSAQHLNVAPSPLHTGSILLLWMTVLAFVYGVVRAVGEKRRVNKSKGFVMKYHSRSPADLRTDCLFIVLFFGVILFPHILQSFMLQADKYFILWFMYFFAIYSVLFEVCESMTKLTLTAKLFSNPMGLAIVILSACIVGGFMYHHMVCAVGESGAWHHGGFFASVAAQGLIFFFPAEDDNVKLHIHHYYWPLSLLQLCVFVTSQVSLITAAMLCAISMHGISFFGVQPLVYNKTGKIRD